MPTTLTPASPPTFPPSLTEPVDGDACTAGSASGPDQAMLDGIEAARLMLYRGLATKPLLRSVNGTAVVMGGVPAMATTVSGAWTVKGPVAAQTFAVASLEGGGAFVATTLYYMYLSLVAGVVTKQVSTTAPDAYNYYKAGSTAYAYVGSFLVNASGNIVPFTATGGRYRWGLSGGTSFALASTAAPTVLNLRTAPVTVPPTAYIASVALTGIRSTRDTGVTTLFFAPTDGSHPEGNDVIYYTLNPRFKDGAGNSYNTYGSPIPFDIQLDSLGRFTYYANNTGYDASANNYVMGYTEH